MNNDFFRLEIENGIATIWIDSKKDKMNIVSPTLMGDFDQIFNEIATNENIKGAILISAKKDFIAGADIKSFTGEKERGTLETILSSPATRLDIVLGKFLVVMLAAFITAFIALGGMYFGIQTFPDWFSFGDQKRSVMAKTIGNAVPPLLAMHVANVVIQSITESL